jgi:hypothetical protein
MLALPSSLISSLSIAPAGACLPDTVIGLPEALSVVPDPRARRGVRHRLTVVVTAALCAVVAGCRSYTAIAEWVADLPEQTADRLGLDTPRRPSEAMIRRLLQALDHDRLTVAIGSWLAAQVPAPATGSRRAIAVDGKTLRGTRTTTTTARHVLAAAEQTTDVCRLNRKARRRHDDPQPPSQRALLGQEAARVKDVGGSPFRAPTRFRSASDQRRIQRAGVNGGSQPIWARCGMRLM